MNKYSKNNVSKSGRELAVLLNYDNTNIDFCESHAITEHIEIVNFWSEKHLAILDKQINSLQRLIDQHNISNNQCMYAGRLKKLDTILNKLNRMPKTKLSRLNDIAGIRIIVPTLADLNYLLVAINTSSQLKDNWIIRRDYLSNPKENGYRAVHFECTYEDSYYGNLKGEVQLRTEKQHAWATAIEMIDIGKQINQMLKFGAKDSDDYKFFSVASDLIFLEETNSSNYLGLEEYSLLCNKLQEINRKAKVLERLKTVNSSFFRNPELEEDEYDYKYIALVLNKEEQYIFTRNISSHEEYFQLELSLSEISEHKLSFLNNPNNVVLVSPDAKDNLDELYPNYLGDISKFIYMCENWLSQNYYLNGQGKRAL